MKNWWKTSCIPLEIDFTCYWNEQSADYKECQENTHLDICINSAGVLTTNMFITFVGLLKRQAPPPRSKNSLYSAMLHLENFLEWYTLKWQRISWVNASRHQQLLEGGRGVTIFFNTVNPSFLQPLCATGRQLNLNLKQNQNKRESSLILCIFIFLLYGSTVYEIVVVFLIRWSHIIVMAATHPLNCMHNPVLSWVYLPCSFSLKDGFPDFMPGF